MNSCLFVFFLLFSSISASGHLRLELTSSNECHIRLTTTVTSKSVYLRTGEQRTVSFHPKTVQQLLQVEFSVGKAVQSHSFQLKVTGETESHVYVFHGTAILVQSTFYCDQGFYGEYCDSTVKPTTTTSTSTTSTTTTTSATSTTVTSSTFTTEASLPTEPTTTTQSEPVSTDSIIIICLSIVVFSLLLIIAFTALLLLPRHQNVYAEATTPKGKKKISMEDSGFGRETPDNMRYTSSPHTTIRITDL